MSNKEKKYYTLIFFYKKERFTKTSPVYKIQWIKKYRALVKWMETKNLENWIHVNIYDQYTGQFVRRIYSNNSFTPYYVEDLVHSK